MKPIARIAIVALAFVFALSAVVWFVSILEAALIEGGVQPAARRLVLVVAGLAGGFAVGPPVAFVATWRSRW